MHTDKEEKKGPKRIGELLVAANIIKADVLAQALQIARESKSPIGRTLMSMGTLSQEELEAAIELQGWLREGVISTEFGVRALNLAIKGKISLEQAFDKLGWQPPNREDGPKSELAELLLEAGIVTFQVLDVAVNDSRQNHMTLGRYLVLNNIVSSQMLSSILTAQVLLRDEKITREQAILALKSTVRKQQSIEETLNESGACQIETNDVRMGDLLTSSGLISEEDKVSAIEMGLAQKKPLGEILVDSHMISEPVLDETLKLQKLVVEKQLSADEAAAALKQTQTLGTKITSVPSSSLSETVLEKDEAEATVAAIEMLKQIGIISNEQINQANKACQEKNLSLCDALILNGALTEGIVTASRLASNLVNAEIISSEQATALLSYCSKERSEFHQALLKVPWLEDQAPADTH